MQGHLQSMEIDPESISRPLTKPLMYSAYCFGAPGVVDVMIP